MKNLKFLVAGMLICSAAFISSCKKDDVTTTTTTSVSLNNKLAFNVKDLGGNVVANATVKTFSSADNRTLGNATNTSTTDSNGNVTFENFAAGTTYYYSVDASIGGTSKHAEGSVVSEQNKTVTTAVKFN